MRRAWSPLVPLATAAVLAATAVAAGTAGVVTVTADPATGTVTMTDAAPAPDVMLVRSKPGAITVAQTGLIADQGGCTYDATVHNATLLTRDGALVCPGTRLDADLGPGDDILDLVGTAIGAHAQLGPGADKGRFGSAADVADGGPGRDTLDMGGGDDLVTVHDGAKDRVFCGPGTDTIVDVPDPDDDIRSDCEQTRYAWGMATPLPRVRTVGAGGAVSVTIGHADQTVTLETRLVSAPPRAAHEAPRTLARATAPVAAGAPAVIALKLGGLTHKPLSTRKVLRVALVVVARTADGTRTPVRLAASLAKAAPGDPDVLLPGQLVLRIPDALRHPKHK